MVSLLAVKTTFWTVLHPQYVQPLLHLNRTALHWRVCVREQVTGYEEMQQQWSYLFKNLNMQSSWFGLYMTPVGFDFTLEHAVLVRDTTASFASAAIVNTSANSSLSSAVEGLVPHFRHAPTKERQTALLKARQLNLSITKICTGE